MVLLDFTYKNDRVTQLRNTNFI